MSCKGLHCPGCGDGGAELAALVVVLAIVAGVVHAIWHTIVEAAEITGLVLVSAAGAAVLAGGVYAAMRIRSRILRSRQNAPGRPISAWVVSQVPPEPAPELEVSHMPALEAPRLAWPLPVTNGTWWDEIRPRIDRDDNEGR